MTNMLDTGEEQSQSTKKPTFLIVLGVLSFVSIGISLLGLLSTLISGPSSEAELEKDEAAVYKSISEMREAGMDDFVPMMEKTIQLNYYINNEVFYSYNLLNLFAVIIGLIGVIFMLQLKKIGFHLYVIYSLLPVIIMYVILPMELIITASVVISIVISAIFCVLYGLNLKHMK